MGSILLLICYFIIPLCVCVCVSLCVSLSKDADKEDGHLFLQVEVACLITAVQLYIKRLFLQMRAYIIILYIIINARREVTEG